MTIFKLPRYIGYFVRCFFLFKHPLSVIWCYFWKTSPKNLMVELRNGFKIYLSKHPHDIVTVFVVFAKKDYGKVMPNSVVVDIGANIGMFSLYAVCCGARKIYAYEPNREAYKILLRNIINNKLEDVIVPFQFAVLGTDEKIVKIPIESSPYNQVWRGEYLGNFELVRAVTMEDILSNNSIDSVDLLKIDCEGGEYEIFFNAQNSVFSRIKEIRMEYHPGPLDNLISLLEGYRFRRTCLKRDSAVLWATKT